MFQIAGPWKLQNLVLVIPETGLSQPSLETTAVLGPEVSTSLLPALPPIKVALPIVITVRMRWAPRPSPSGNILIRVEKY